LICPLTDYYPLKEELLMRMKKLTREATALMIVAFLAASWVAADAPPGPYFNGFETDTAGWFNFSGATITRVPSGSPSTYANGVLAAAGTYYWPRSVWRCCPH